MAVGYKSGYLGTVTWDGTLVPDVMSVTNDKDANTQRHQTSSTLGKFRRTIGGDDKSGSFVIARDGVPASMIPGAVKQLLITSDGTETMYNDLAYIEAVNVNVPIDGGGIVTMTVRWGQTVA